MKNYYILLAPLLLWGLFTKAQTTTFSYTGSVQTYTVPICVTSITVDVKGAKGSDMTYNGQTSNGGKGGRVTCSFPVTPGDVLSIYVGGQGGSPNQNSPGYNGGGTGGNNTYCAGGAGASDIRLNGTALANRIIVGAGGAGAGTNCWGNGDHGGDGGGLTGAPGCQCNSCVGGSPNYPGAGGTQVAGGAAGNDQGQGCTQAGTLGQGGNGACTYGGGGGGGYYGGGGGGYGGGGGGSSYTAPGATNVIHTAGFQTGNGEVIITVNAPAPPPMPGAISGNDTVCENSTEIYSISPVPGALSYTWTAPAGATINSGQGTTSINVTYGNTSGDITVTADSACGSSAAKILPIIVGTIPSVTFTLSQDTICLNAPALTLSGGNPGGGTFSGNGVAGGAFTPSVAGIGTHVITYTYTDGPCTNTAIDSIVVDACAGISDYTLLNQISVFPNPSKGNLFITVPSSDNNISLDVEDLQGKVVMQINNLEVKGGQASVSLQELPNGLYNLHFRTLNNDKVIKISLMK
jgi:hypothetical protein